MIKYALSLLTFIFCLSSANAVMAHEVIDVTDGGAVTGTVMFKGEAPADEMIAITSDQEYCGKEQKALKYVINDSRIKNAVVWIDDVKRGKPITIKETHVTIEKCRAVPHVNLGFVGGEYIFKNNDKILHTIQSKLGLAYQKKVSDRPLEDGASIYNFALPKAGIEVRKPIKNWHRYTDETGFVQIRSNTHNWIRGYIFVFDHPYATTTDAKGNFSIDGLPAGEYTMKVWHEGLGEQEQKITISAGKSSEVKISFAK